MKGKKERGEQVFQNRRDKIILVAILALFVLSIVLMATGTIDLFA